MTATSCPDRERLYGYLVGTLPEEHAETVAEHLTSCATCRRTVEALEGLPDAVIGALRRTADHDAYSEEPEYKEALQRLRSFPIPPPIPSPDSEAQRADSGSAKRRPPKPPRIPKLGDYELLYKLGEGGMGTVYKARHARMMRIVALKVLPKERLSDEEAIGRFELEMQAVGRLDHPNIVRALDARKIGETHLLAMEYIDGLDLSKVVKRHGPLSIPDACEVVRQAATGLACSHENNLVHRDIKPSNLMLNSTGQVKILDLGLAQIQEAETLGGSGTGAGPIIGTPDYMSPEQASRSQNLDVRSDLYALGCALYYLLAGHPPFKEPEYDTPMKKVTAHIRDVMPPILSVRPDVPKPVARLLEKMVVKDLNKRVARPVDVANALAPFCKGAKLISLLREASGKGDEHESVEGRIETRELRASAMVDTSRDDLAEDRAGHREGAEFDPYHRWLGIPTEDQPANHYRLLGLACFEADPEVIRDAALRQISHVRGYELGRHSELSQKVLGELAAAKKCLLDPRRKAEYDAGLRQQPAQRTSEAERARPLRALADRARAKLRMTSGSTSAAPARQTAGPSSLPFWTATRGRIAFLLVTLAFVFFASAALVLRIDAGHGSARIAISDPRAKVQVTMDGDLIEVEALDEPLQLKPGEHKLVVRGPNHETVRQSFDVKQGEDTVLNVELIPKKQEVSTAHLASRSGAAVESVPKTDGVSKADETAGADNSAGPKQLSQAKPEIPAAPISPSIGIANDGRSTDPTAAETIRAAVASEDRELARARLESLKSAQASAFTPIAKSPDQTAEPDRASHAGLDREQRSASELEAKAGLYKLQAAIAGENWDGALVYLEELRSKHGDSQTVQNSSVSLDDFDSRIQKGFREQAEVDERVAREKLRELKALTKERDYVRADIVARLLREKYGNTPPVRDSLAKLETWSAEIETALSSRGIKKKDEEYLIFGHDPRSGEWHKAVEGAKERLLWWRKQYDGSPPGRKPKIDCASVLFRVVSEDASSESAFAVQQTRASNCDMNVTKDDGYAQGKWVRNGEIVCVSAHVVPGNQAMHSGIAQVYAMNHYSPHIDLTFVEGEVTVLGDIVLRSIPEEERGRIAVRTQLPEGMEFEDEKVRAVVGCAFTTVAQDGKVREDSTTVAQELKLSPQTDADGRRTWISPPIAAGTYGIDVDPISRLYSERPVVRVHSGETAEVDLPLLRQQRISFDWWARELPAAAKWKHGRQSLLARTGWIVNCRGVGSLNFFALLPRDESIVMELLHSEALVVEGFRDIREFKFPAEGPFSREDIEISEGTTVAFRSGARPEKDASGRLQGALLGSGCPYSRHLAG